VNWISLIPTPPFPSYTAAHSQNSAAVAAVLAGFFGRDDVSFVSSSEGLITPDREFQSFSQAAQQAADSRLYGGIHWSFDNEVGLATGRAIGEYVYATQLLPVPEPSVTTLVVLAALGLLRRADRR
jgi:hypothetical protein